MFLQKEIRRCSDPERAQQLWDAIKAVRSQKQVPAITRMARYMSRYYHIKKEETQRLLNLAVEDNLIKLETKVGLKGAKVGVEERAYRLPTLDMLARDKHDWYCFHCHSAGEVVLCALCHRVYHEACVKEPVPPQTDFFCYYCKSANTESIESIDKAERRDLNNLLRIVCRRLADKIPVNYLIRETPAVSLPNKSANIPGSSTDLPLDPHSTQESSDKSENIKDETVETWRSTFLLKQQTDLNQMDLKCQSVQYRSIDEFKADAQLIVHNMTIYHGVQSNMADLARQMFRDVSNNLREMALCRDCFRYSHHGPSKSWFCKPCRPTHQIVYAKQKGFPYWPAKVMRQVDGMFDVRFFGGYHQRALVEKSHVKPVTINIHSLQVKRTPSWTQACEELRKYQECLEKLQQDEDFFKSEFDNSYTTEAENKSTLDCESESKGAVCSSEEWNIESSDVSKSKSLSDISSEIQPCALVEKKRKKLNKNKKPQFGEDGAESIVSSSSSFEHKKGPICAMVNASVQTPINLFTNSVPNLGLKSAEFKEFAHRLRLDFDQEKKRAVNVATRSLERDLERLKGDHATEIDQLTEAHHEAISQVKKKQWCFHCENEAIYWCCWNTAYCSIECQQDHWHKKHKRECRRKR